MRDTELGAVVSRELVRRVRGVDSSFAHEPVARSSIKLAARLVEHLDSIRDVWHSQPASTNGEESGPKDSEASVEHF